MASGTGLREGGRPGATSEAVLRRNRAVTRTPRVRLPLADREGIVAGKKRLLSSLTEAGVADIERIIRMGPFAKVVVQTKDGQQVIELHEERSRLWQFAMNFAADRGGLPRVSEVDVAISEGVPPVKVELPGFPKPSDS